MPPICAACSSRRSRPTIARRIAAAGFPSAAGRLEPAVDRGRGPHQRRRRETPRDERRSARELHARRSRTGDLDVVVEPHRSCSAPERRGSSAFAFSTTAPSATSGASASSRGAARRIASQSPIAVQPVTLRAAPGVFLLAAARATATLPVGVRLQRCLRRDGARAAAPTLDANGQVPRGFVDDDPTNTFSFRVRQRRLAARASPCPPISSCCAWRCSTSSPTARTISISSCSTARTTSALQLAKSDGVTSDEEIDVARLKEGSYVLLVHGFETDQVAGGPGASYSLFTWSLGVNDAVGNLSVTRRRRSRTATASTCGLSWSGLDQARAIWARISHTTPGGSTSLTVVDIVTPASAGRRCSRR